MKKSPFSTPRGNGGWHSPNWQSGGTSGRGYGRPKSFEFSTPNRSDTSRSSGGSDDFIPFDNTTPPCREKWSPNPHWQSPRGHWNNNGGGRGARRQSTSPGYQNYRENRSWNNHQQTPYFQDNGRQFQGPRKNFQRGNGRRKPDISQYVNLKSFLEDPWMEISKQFGIDVSAEDSKKNDSANSSCGASALMKVVLSDSIDETVEKDTNLEIQKCTTDGSAETDNSFVKTSQEFVDTSILSDSSTDIKLSQESIDSFS